jgi:hypothetical protein
VHFPLDNMKVLLQGYATTQQYTLIFTRIDIHIIFHSWRYFLNFLCHFSHQYRVSSSCDGTLQQISTLL